MKQQNRRLLFGAYCVLFLRYTVATFLSAFFGTVPPGSGMTGTMDGFIFAAYPLGMALTSLFAPQARAPSLPSRQPLRRRHLRR